MQKEKKTILSAYMAQSQEEMEPDQAHTSKAGC